MGKVVEDDRLSSCGLLYLYIYMEEALNKRTFIVANSGLPQKQIEYVYADRRFYFNWQDLATRFESNSICQTYLIGQCHLPSDSGHLCLRGMRFVEGTYVKTFRSSNVSFFASVLAR